MKTYILLLCIIVSSSVCVRTQSEAKATIRISADPRLLPLVEAWAAEYKKIKTNVVFKLYSHNDIESDLDFNENKTEKDTLTEVIVGHAAFLPAGSKWLAIQDVYDIKTRKLKSVSGGSNALAQHDNVDHLIAAIETKTNNAVRLSPAKVTVRNKRYGDCLAFTTWILEHGATSLHRFGYIVPEKGLAFVQRQRIAELLNVISSASCDGLSGLMKTRKINATDQNQ